MVQGRARSGRGRCDCQLCGWRCSALPERTRSGAVRIRIRAARSLPRVAPGRLLLHIFQKPLAIERKGWQSRLAPSGRTLPAPTATRPPHLTPTGRSGPPCKEMRWR